MQKATYTKMTSPKLRCVNRGLGKAIQQPANLSFCTKFITGRYSAGLVTNEWFSVRFY